jgi:hypothetical protein
VGSFGGGIRGKFEYCGKALHMHYVEDMIATDGLGDMEITASYRDLTKGILTGFIAHGNLDQYICCLLMS